MSNASDPSGTSSTIDVGQEQLARMYAKAFLGATESLDQQALVAELESLVADVLDKFPEFDRCLTSDGLSHDERSQLIDGVLGGRASEPVINLLKVLSERHRYAALRAVVRAIRKMYDEQNGRREVQVYVPQSLSDDLQASLRQALQSRLGIEPKFTFHINPDLIGGMIVQVGDTVFDASVRTEFEKARQRMIVEAIDAIETRPERFLVEAS